MADIKSLIDRFNIFRTKDSILNDAAKDNGQITIDIKQPFSDDLDSNNSLKTKLETNIKDKLFNTEINNVGSNVFDEKIKPFDKGYNVSNTPDTDTKTPIDTTPIKPDTPTIEKNSADATAIQQEKIQEPEITTQEPEPEATQQYKTIIIQKKPKLTTDSLGNYMPIDYEERKGTSYSGVGEQQIDELYNILKDDEKKFDMFMGSVYEALDQLKSKPLNDTENIIFLPYSFDQENGNMNGARLSFGLGQKEWAEKQLKTLATKLTDKQNEEWLSNLKLPEPETTMDKITSNPWGKLLSFMQPPTNEMDPKSARILEEGQQKNRLNAIKWRLIDKINECKKVFDKYYGDKSQVGTALSQGNIAETVYNILLPKMKLAEDAEIALILKKSKENPKGLTPIENEIVNYSKMLFRALSVIDSKTTTGYKTTKSILNSLPFMADFFRANFVGGAIKSGIRGGTRTAMKLAGKSAAKETAKDVTKSLVTRAGKFAGDIGTAAVQTTLSPLTPQNMLEDYSQTIATNGQYTKNDLRRGVIEAFTENFSERMFGALKGILPKSNNAFVNSLFGNNPVIKSMQKHMNVGGLFEETAEEYAGAFLNTMFGFALNDEKLSNSFKEQLNNSATTILSIAITVGLPQAIGMGIDFREIRKLNNRFNVAENNLKQYFNNENSYLDINRYSDGLKSLYINLNNAKNEEDKAEIKGKIAELNKTAANLAMEKGDSNGFNLISEYSIAAQNSFYVTNKAMSELKDMSEEDRTKLSDNAINKLKNDFTNNLNWSLISRAAAKNITDQNGKQHPTCFLYTDNGVTYVLNGQKDNMFSFVDVNGNTISKSADELRNNENLSVLHLNNLLSSFSNKELEDINSKFIDIAQYNAGYRYKVNDNGEIRYYFDNKDLINSNTPYEQIDRDKIESNLVGSYDLVRIDNITNAVEDMANAFAEPAAEQTDTEQPADAEQTSEQQPAQETAQETIEQPQEQTTQETAQETIEHPAEEQPQETAQEQPTQEQTTEEQETTEQETTEQEPIQPAQQQIEPTQQQQTAQEEDVNTNNADKKHNDWYVTEEVTIKDGIKKTKYSKWRKSNSGEFKRVASSGKPISLEEAQDIFDLEDIYLDDVRNLEIIEIRDGENGAWATIKVTYNFNQTVNFDVKVKKKRNDDSTALNGVPDIVDDTPKDARTRGFRRVNGYKIDRQKPLQAVNGKEIAIRFSNDVIANGHVAVIDAEQLQPSHIQGVRNPLHFIDEAQPKERNDEASIVSAQRIAKNIRPEEITSSVTAYTGAPIINARGETIQGNNRSDALRLMWSQNKDQAEKYKQYLIDHAQEFGLNAEDIAAMERPILVNMIDVSDEDAIALGQYVAQDTESGGLERIKPKNAVQKMGADMRTFANLLLSSNDDEISFAGLIDKNGVDVLNWLGQKGYITPTQYKSAFDTKGYITAEAKNDLRGIMYQSIFQGGSTRLEEMFNTMPAKAQKAILATAFRDYDSPKSESMIIEIQNSIRAYYALSQSADFMNAKTYKDVRLAVEGWKKQYQIDDATGESYLPAENFSNFALLLATMYKGEKQTLIQGTFNKLYDLIQGTQEADLFETPDNTPRTLSQAIKEVLNIDYNGQQRSNVLVGDTATSQRGEQRSTRDAATRERTKDGERTADSAGSIEAESRVAQNEQANTKSQVNKPNIPQTEETALRDALIDKLREAGIDVITDVEEAQRVLDEANGKEIRQQKVYHGSGADFDAFDFSHMGEGTGNKAFGWGGYVSESEGVGRMYVGEKAQLYLIEIPDDNGSNYLHFEKPIGGDMVRKVKDALYQYIVSSDEEGTYSDNKSRYALKADIEVIDANTKGGDVYGTVSDFLGGDKQASEFLSSIGFVGISYNTGFKSGETTDNTRNYVIFNENDLKIVDKIRFFRTADGNAYGFTVGGKIYIDPRIATADTPIHEYAHLWASAMQKLNPNEWANIVKLMKGTPIWEEVKRNYPELTNDNEIADEVLAFYSGSRGAERLRDEHAKILKGNGNVVEKVKAINAIKRVREALKRFWKNVADWFGIHFTTAEEVADKVLSDLLNGVNPTLAGIDNDIRFEENSEEAEIVAMAKADGTYMKAPNGKQSNLSPRQWVQVRTKAFKDWFGDWENDPDNSSKVVDENGEPMVVYHGSGDTFTIFSPQSEWHGNFFSSERSVAKSYSPTADNVIFEERKRPFVDVKFKDGRIERQYYDLGGIYNVYLDINKPLVVDCKGKNWNDIHFKGIKTTTDHISDYALKQGYDGVIFINLIDGAHRGLESSNSFVAFNSNQIKSATDNVGTFDQNNPDIRYQFVGEKGAAAMDKAEEATIRLDNLAVARDMEKAGKDAKDIKFATGWERGAEGKWRYEILDGKFDPSGELHSERRRLSDEEQKELDDAFFETMEAFSKGNDAYTKEITEDTDMADIYEAGGMERSKAERISFLEKKKSELSKKPKTLDDYIDNEELFAAYPELRDLVVEVGNRNAALIGNFGAYLPEKNIIRLNDISLSTLSHEVQHAIQDIEGFALGGSKSNVRNTIKKNIKASKELSDKIKGKSNMELYRAIMGEVEARNVQSRLGMSAEERRRSLAKETEDVERKDQIFLEDGLGVSASEVDKKANAVNRRASNRSVISSRFERQAEIQREEKNTKSAANIVLGNANVVLNDTDIFDEQYQNAIDNNLIDENVSPLIDSFGITWGYQLKNGVIVINKDVFVSDILDKRVKDNLSLLISSLMKTNKTFFKEGISFFKKLPIWVLYKNDTKSNEDTIQEIINDILLGNTSIDTNKLELLKQYTVQDMNDILDNATKWFEKFEDISSNMFAGNSISDILDTTLGDLMPKEITTTQEGKRLNWFSKLGIDIRSKLFDSLDWFRVVSDKTKDKTASELYDAMIVHTKRVQGRIDVFDKEYVRPIIDTIQSMLGKDFGNSTLSLDLIQEYFAIKSLLGRTASLYKEKFEAYLTNPESKKPPMFDEFKQIYDEITEDEIKQRINEMGGKSDISILQKVDIDYLMEEVRRTLAAEMFVKQYVYSSANTLNQGLQGEQSLGLINEVTNEPYSELYQLLYSDEQSSQTMHSPIEIIEQADILIDRAGLREEFDFIGNQIQAILNYVNIERVENGLMSYDTFAKRQLMKDFVNQRGENSSEGNLYEITAKQKANEKMKGKDWFNPNSITSIIAVAQTEIATMEKELLAQRLSYFLTNPNNFDVLSQYGMIIDEKETLNEELSEEDRNYIMDKNIVLLYGDRHTDKNTKGQVDKKQIKILKRNDDGTFTKVTISFDNKFIGLEEFVKFVNNNFKYEELRGLSKAAAPFTAWFSRMYTILSPLFPTKNLFKDLMVTPWLPAKELNGKNSQYAIKNFYNAFNNLSFILKMSFTEKSFSKKGFENKLKARSQELFEYYLEYSKQHSIFSIEDQIGALSKENKTLQDIEKALSGKENKFIKFTERALLIKFMQHYAELFENLHKFSAYVTLRKLGYGEERSAQIANNATLNYDRSGSIGRQLNAIIPFAKAALGGLYRTNYLLPKYNPKGFLQRVITLAVLGVMQGLMYDPDDDDISEFARKSGMVFGSFLYPLLPEELSIVRPVRALVIVMAGKKSPAYFKQELMESTIDLVPIASDALRGAFSYNPLTNKPEFDAGQLFANTDKMTAVYALAMLASYINENKNSFGKNVLLNEETNTDKTRYGRTKQDYGLYDYIARLYNSILNGVDIDDRAAMSNKIGKNGERLMTIAKEDVEFVINNYIPFGRLYAYTAEIIYDAVNDKRINKGHIPLIGGLFAQKSFGKDYYLINNIKYELKDFTNDFSQNQIEDIKTNILVKAGIREGIRYKAIKDDNNVHQRRKDKAKRKMNDAFNLFILNINNVDKKDFTEDEQKFMLKSFLDSSIMKKALSIGEDTLNKHTVKRIEGKYDRYKKYNNENYDADKENMNEARKNYQKMLYDKSITEEEFNDKLNSLWEPMFEQIKLRAILAGFSINL